VATLPESIPNIAELSRQLSERGGFFDTDNLISNERGYQQVLPAMRRLGVRGGAYVGVGPDQNYTYIARTAPRIAFLVDVRRDNLLQHLLYKALFATSAGRADFLAQLTGRALTPAQRSARGVAVDTIVRWIDRAPMDAASQRARTADVWRAVTAAGFALSDEDRNTIARFHGEFVQHGLGLRFTSLGRAPQPYYPTFRQLVLERDADGRQMSYLADDSAFAVVQTMHRQHRIVPVVGDLASPTLLPRLGHWLRERGIGVSTLYTSNVEDYLIRDGTFATYVRGVRALPRAPNAVIVRSWFGGGYGHPEASPAYHATQLLQRLDRFAGDVGVESVDRYRTLVNRDWIALRAAFTPPAAFGPGARSLLDAH
jgi:hypothetical protein